MRQEYDLNQGERGEIVKVFTGRKWTKTFQLSMTNYRDGIYLKLDQVM